MKRRTFVAHPEGQCKEDDCDLCAARARKQHSDELLARGKPTLTHQPFADLLTAGAGKRTVPA